MLYRSLAVTVFAAYTLSGCSESHSEAKKREFVEVAKSAKNVNMLQKVDKDLGKLQARVMTARLEIPKGSADDTQVAARAVDALIAYFEIGQVDKQVREILISYTASARSKYSSHAALFDSAVSHLETSLVKQKDPKSLALPNYAVYDFIRAVFHILTDEYFGIESQSDFVKALECSSGVVAACIGPSNKLNQEVLDSMSVVTPTFKQYIIDDDFAATLVGKSLFAPIYVFLNHQSIDYEIREWAVKLAVSFANMLANAPTDPEEMVEYLRDARSQIELSQADMVMIQRIRMNLKFLQSRLQSRGLFSPAGFNIRFAAPMNNAVESIHM